MKIIIAVLILMTSSVAYADLDLKPYIEYKNELNYTNKDFNQDIHHFRFGVETGKFYGEIGRTTSIDGSGIGGEVGYQFEFGKNLTLAGSWEGIRQNSTLNHTLETKIRWTF